MNNLVLQKGEHIQFLDYTIKNCLNDDGMVLLKKGADNYECHLGNYGQGTEENLTFCKKYALLYFMIARPEKFATIIARKLMKKGGTYLEFSILRQVCENEGIEIPSEITDDNTMNKSIMFNNEQI
jgi:hypothetical protein